VMKRTLSCPLQEKKTSQPFSMSTKGVCHAIDILATRDHDACIQRHNDQLSCNFMHG
jgi:hypothetical protein